MKRSQNENQSPNYMIINADNIILTIFVKPKSKMNRIVHNKSEFIIHTTAAPEAGKANKMIIKQISEYFNISKSSISIVAGRKSSKKKILIKSVEKNDLESLKERITQ